MLCQYVFSLNSKWQTEYVHFLAFILFPAILDVLYFMMEKLTPLNISLLHSLIAFQIVPFQLSCLGISIQISVLKLTNEVWDNKTKQGCVRNAQMLLSTFECFLMFICPSAEENGFTMFRCSDSFSKLTLLWFSFYRQ